MIIHLKHLILWPHFELHPSTLKKENTGMGAIPRPTEEIYNQINKKQQQQNSRNNQRRCNLICNYCVFCFVQSIFCTHNFHW